MSHCARVNLLCLRDLGPLHPFAPIQTNLFRCSLVQSDRIQAGQLQFSPVQYGSVFSCSVQCGPAQPSRLDSTWTENIKNGTCASPQHCFDQYTHCTCCVAMVAVDFAECAVYDAFERMWTQPHAQEQGLEQEAGFILKSFPRAAETPRMQRRRFFFSNHGQVHICTREREALHTHQMANSLWVLFFLFSLGDKLVFVILKPGTLTHSTFFMSRTRKGFGETPFLQVPFLQCFWWHMFFRAEKQASMLRARHEIQVVAIPVGVVHCVYNSEKRLFPCGSLIAQFLI